MQETATQIWIRAMGRKTAKGENLKDAARALSLEQPDLALRVLEDNGSWISSDARVAALQLLR